MTKDYAPSLATAKRLIRKYGRSITLVKLAGESPDASKPWRGATDPRGAGATTTTLSAVGVPTGNVSYLGFRASQEDLLKDVEQVFVAEPGEDDPEGLTDYHLVRDGDDYQIKFIERLRPAELTLLYFIGVAR